MATPSRDAVAAARPTLVYDGDCGICRYWVRYWDGLTGGQVAYRPYQDAAADYPTIPLDAFKRAIQFIAPDGAVYAGAAATFQVLAVCSGARRVVVAVRSRFRLRAPRGMGLPILRASARFVESAVPGCCGARRSNRLATTW